MHWLALTTLGLLSLSWDPVWANPAQVEIPIQEQTYSQLVEQARPLVWQSLARLFEADPDRFTASVEVYGTRAEARAPLFMVTIPQEIWGTNPAPSQMESHAQFFLSSMSLLFPPTPTTIEFRPAP